eukprot:2643551-Pyramimonas_sp.AAC.1
MRDTNVQNASYRGSRGGPEGVQRGSEAEVGRITRGWRWYSGTVVPWYSDTVIQCRAQHGHTTPVKNRREN